MTNIFQTVLQMSVTGSFVICFVCVARVFLKRTPKIYSYVLWALVLFRLLCPVTLTSSVSLVPEELAMPQVQVSEPAEMPDAQVTWTNQGEAPIFSAQEMEMPEKNVQEEEITTGVPEVQPKFQLTVSLSGWEIAGSVWLLGMLALAGYSIFSLGRIYKRVQVSVPLEGNVYLAQDIETPFTLGFFAPKIYLPTGLLEKEASYIIAHEKHHIRRFDHIIKIVAFLTLTIHWFNPLVWVAFVLAGKDMEMSCDEAVMKEFAEDIRQEYSGSLLNLATGRKIISMAPIAFGEGNVKGRIKNVMNYKKPVFWITIVGVAVCAVLAVTLLTNPENGEEGEDTPVASIESEGSESTPKPEVTVAPETPAPENSATQPVGNEEEFLEKEINVFYGDLTGDGINERIVLAVDVLPEGEQEDDLLKLMTSGYLAKVSAYKGLGGGSYAEEVLWSFGDISTSRPGNYQLSLTRKDNKDNLLISYVSEHQGYAVYYYKVISLTENGEELLQDEYEISFKFAEEAEEAEWQSGNYPDAIRSDVVPDFREHMYQWFEENATLIIAVDVNLWEDDAQWMLYSAPGEPVNPMEYYDKVFARQDYYTLMGKTMFTTKYFTFKLPEEWADKVHYVEDENGTVWLYHTETSDLIPGLGLLGTVFLTKQEDALEMMEVGPAIYIGDSFTAENGVTYVPMACEPTDVECGPETEEKYFAMSNYFADGRIAAHVWVTESGYNSLHELAFYKELNPEWGLGYRRAAIIGEKLPWEGRDDDYVLFDTDGEHHTLIINDKDYSDMLTGVLHMDTFENTWYAVVDIDVNDDSREIIVYDDGPSGDPTLRIIRITDGKLAILSPFGNLENMGSFKIPGDGTITAWIRTWSPENNVVERTYEIVDREFVEIPREEYVYGYLDFHKVIQDLEVYKERDLSSEKLTLKAGEEKICFNKVFSSSEEGERFYEVETADGEIYYLYSDGELDDYVAGLSHAG